ncbi:MAG: ATP-binding protein [Pseudomonadota bacterium]
MELPTARRHEPGLFGLVALIIAIILGTGWWDTKTDREVTLLEAGQLGMSVASAVTGRFEATFRDAANAAVSAALRVEAWREEGGLGTQAQLQRELKRQLWDETSTARLVAVAPDGRVVASSTGSGSGTIRFDPPRSDWQIPAEGRAPLRLGLPQRSPFDNTWVVPLWVPVQGTPGIAWIRAEIRSNYMERFLERLPGSYLGSMVIMTTDGIALIRMPHDESVLGVRRPGVVDFLRLAQGEQGTVEFAPRIDNRLRVYAWKRLPGYPVVVAVGFDKEKVLAAWRQRMHARIFASVVFSGVIAGLSLVLVLYLRRLGSAREAGAELEHRYWEAMRSSSNGIAIADLQGRWLQVNPALCLMLGYPEQELLALQPSAIACGTPATGFDALAAQAAAGAADASEENRCLLHRSGRQVWVDAQASVLRDRQGHPRNLAFHFQDATERKQAQDALEQLNRELEQRITERTTALHLANEDLEAFTYSVAHDLRGPIARLGSFVDVLERELETPTELALRRLAALRRQVRDMSALVDDLLAFARAGKQEMRSELVDMDQLVQSVRQELESMHPDRRIEWRLEALPAVQGDRALLYEVWRNLMDNAVKYTKGRAPACIVVEPFSPSANEAGFRISDNGAGFDEAYADNLFAPFKRLHTASEFEGTGVGLAIVHRILVRHGGRIWGHGSPGDGASFFLALPK